VARGDVIVIHVPDDSNAADFLTKWIPVAKLNASIAYTSNAAAKQDGVNAPQQAPALEASALEIEWVYMTLRSGTRKHAPTIAKEAAWGDPPSPVEEPPHELSVDDKMEVEEVDDDEESKTSSISQPLLPRSRRQWLISTRTTARRGFRLNKVTTTLNSPSRNPLRTLRYLVLPPTEVTGLSMVPLGPLLACLKNPHLTYDVNMTSSPLSRSHPPRWRQLAPIREQSGRA